MSLARRAGVLLVVVALTVGLGGALAGGKKHKKKRKGKSWTSQITLVQPSSTSFSGTVSSKLEACRDERVVTVYYTDPQTGQTLPLSVQRTDNRGRYQVTLTKPAFTGAYHAQVIKRKVRAKKAKQTCKGAQSSSVSVVQTA